MDDVGGRVGLGLVGEWCGLCRRCPGITATEIKVGGVFPFSGPASSIGLVGRGVLAFGYTQGMLLEQILQQCGSDLSRENILKQAKSLMDVVLPTVLPGIKINTREDSNMDFTQLRLQRWTGTNWDLFSGVIDAKSE